MANLNLIVFENDTYKRRASGDTIVDFSSIRIGTSTLEIKETSGHFDFSAKKLTNIADGTANTDAVAKLQMENYVASQVSGFIPSSEKGAPNGVATLDAAGKIPSSQLTVEVFEYKGNWSAATNTPTLANGTGNTGDVYHVSASGTVDFGAGNISFIVGDKVVYNGTVWEKWGTAVVDAVTSVNSQTGVVVLDTDDIAEGTTNLYFTNERAQDAVGSALTNTSSIEATYNDTANEISFAIASQGVSAIHLSNDIAGNGLIGGGGSAIDVGAGEAIKVDANSVGVDYAVTKTNENASAITAGQIVYIKSNGAVDLARADVTDLFNHHLGIVESSSIAASASGKIVVRQGKIMGGYSGLTPGKKQYVSRSTAGALTESLAGFVSGEYVYCVGRAISATEIVFDPEFIIEW